MNGYLLWSYPNIGGDAIAFLLPIHHLIAGDGYSLGSEPSLLFSPGYGLLAAPIYFFIRDIEYSGMLVSGFSYIGLVCVTYICISKILDKRAALISSLFITFSPLLISRSYINLADIAATFFIVLSVLLTVRVIVINTSRKVYFVIGLLFGFGTLIRPDCLLVAVGCAGVVIIIYLIDIMKQERGSVSLWSIVLSIVGFFFCVFPYMLYLHTHTGIWTISTKLSLLAVGGSGVHDVAIDASFFDTLMNTVKYDLVGTFDRMYTSGKFCLYSFVVCNFYMIVPVLFIWLSHPFFAFQGLGRSVFSKTDTMRGAAIFAVSFIPLIPYLLYAKADRRWLPYWTLFEIAAGIFVYFLLRGMIKDENNKTWLVTITIIGFSVIVSPFLPLPPFMQPHTLQSATYYSRGHDGLRGAGFWLKDNVPIEDRTKILSRKPSVVVFYAYDKNIAPSYGNGLSKNSEILESVSQLDYDSIKYMIPDYHYIKEMQNFQPLWNQPALAHHYGIDLIASSSTFKIFSKKKGQ